MPANSPLWASRRARHPACGPERSDAQGCRLRRAGRREPGRLERAWALSGVSHRVPPADSCEDERQQRPPAQGLAGVPSVFPEKGPRAGRPGHGAPESVSWGCRGVNDRQLPSHSLEAGPRSQRLQGRFLLEPPREGPSRPLASVPVSAGSPWLPPVAPRSHLCPPLCRSFSLGISLCAPVSLRGLLLRTVVTSD